MTTQTTATPTRPGPPATPAPATAPPTGRQVLRRAVTGQGRYVALGSLLAVGHQAGEALVPVIIGVVVDQAVATGSTTALVRWLVVLGLVFAGLSTSFRFAARAGERAAEQAAHRIRRELTARVLAPYGGVERGHLPGALVNIATSDASRVGAVNMALTAGAAALAALVTTAVVLLHTSVPLGLLILLGAPPVLWIAHLLGGPLQRRSEAEQENAAHASGVAADLVSGLRILKGIGAEQAASARYRLINRRSLAATLRAARAQAWHDGALIAVTGAFITAVALLGARLAIQGDITIGELIAAVGLALFLLNPLSTLSWVNAELAQARASAARVAAVHAAAPAVHPGTVDLADPVRGELRFDNVTDGPLRISTLRVSPGELLGVVAPDPAAASALVRCLAREADPETGTITLDGVALTDLDPARVRTAMLTASHDAVLFAGTVRENVTAAGNSEGPLETVLTATTVDQVARVLPDGLGTPVSERGHSLSGGQRQRIALARALHAEPPVLVVHEPTTAVDTATEARIATSLRQLREGRTTILVTSSPALLAVTDRVVLLDGDRDPVTGRHADLVRGHERYRATVLA
ncbi:putative ABC transport system ATP-binding protein [Micromonospora pisi]|uniref:Putative ABC transport system ATP-binding protein n=1 Tax=Micromonospora pisi TaxID=589240 RepID=A0A495JAQ6_9ACTN|nr:ABC transporter ATP-binding protein [Micromonospora pisi]RKR85913.1 putative ABC transport system ATP-binding protein [Micromonospora pisi]